MTVSKLKHLGTSKLKVHPNNPRFIKDDEFKALIKSIQEDSEYFEARPVICSDRTGELVILGGNQRFRAACDLKLKTVPCIVFSYLTEADEVRLMMKDNANNFGQFDWDIITSQGWDELIKENESLGVLFPVFDDYSDKNKEINTDEFSEKMTLKFELSENEYRFICDGLAKIDANKEAAILKLLKYEP